MALLIPDPVDAFATEGEERFHAFLGRAAKPDGRFVAWYSPRVSDGGEERFPDFILYNPEVGLVVFEVKDWALDQVREADPRRFLLAIGGREQARQNPYQQAKDYYGALRTRIERDGRLVSRDGATLGKCSVPISCAVVLANVARHEYEGRFGNDGIIPLGKIFFWDDLDPDSEYHDGSGERFLASLKERFPLPFPYRGSSRDLEALRQILFPVVRVPEVRRGPSPDREGHEARVALLDRLQESVARRYGPGRRVVTGGAGSGKTLVLVHQAAFLRESFPKVRRLLYLCFNSSLVNHVRRLLSLKGVPLGREGVEVLPFFELCQGIVGDAVSHEREESAYYDMVLDEALSRDPGERFRYDAVLVDEGQDFDTRMLQLALKCLDPATDVFTVALDEGQDLYGRTRDWGALGINLRGKVHRLGRGYRNTAEIAAFAERVRTGGLAAAGTKAPPAGDAPAPGGGQPSLFPDPPATHGPEPEVVPFPSVEDAIAWTAKRIRSLRDEGSFSLAETAVIYTSRGLDAGSPLPFPARVAEALEREGIVSRWVTEDYRSRRSCDVTTDSVAISTIHSAKGLDYGCVFLFGLDTLDRPGDGDEARRRARNLAYVGITRARYRLVVPITEGER